MSLTSPCTPPVVPLEADVLTPGPARGLLRGAGRRAVVVYGNQSASSANSSASGARPTARSSLIGDLSRVKRIGAGMTRGRIVVHGDVGMHLGAGMTGGEIVVEGNAGDWVGAGMSGGRIISQGQRRPPGGQRLARQPAGILGGEIIVHGNAGNEVGGGMRRGLIAIGGDTGDFTGVNMLAGTVVVLGQLGRAPVPA